VGLVATPSFGSQGLVSARPGYQMVGKSRHRTRSRYAL